MPRSTREKAAPVSAACSLDLSVAGCDAKLNAKLNYIKDFELQVKKKRAVLEGRMKKYIADMNRVFSTEKLKLPKEVRQMTLKEFEERGGDLEQLTFPENGALAPRVSFMVSGVSDADTTGPSGPVEMSVFDAADGLRKKVLMSRHERDQFLGEDSTLENKSLRATRSSARRNANSNNTATEMVTPVLRGRGRGRGRQAHKATPMITPKFDTRKPLTGAREPKKGETLVSLCGSPVIHSAVRDENEDPSLISINLTQQKTMVSGAIFAADTDMSPDTILDVKKRMEELQSVLGSRIETFNSQLSGMNITTD